MGHPQIGVFARLADRNAAPIRKIQGQNTKLNRTVHGVSYDEIHDEILVSSQIGQAVLIFRGEGSGDEAPVRYIQGPKTQILVPEMVEVDPVNNEIFVPSANQVLVFNRTDQGDVAPKRTLMTRSSRVAVDYVHNVLIVSRNGSNGAELAIYDRTAAGSAAPLRVITGPGTMLRGAPRHGFDVHPATGMILVSVPSGDLASDRSFVGVWSINDNGNVPPRWTVGGPFGALRNPRGVTVDPIHKTMVVSDKYLNGVLTFSFPQMFEQTSAVTTSSR